jgi:hypothetical protein
MSGSLLIRRTTGAIVLLEALLYFRNLIRVILGRDDDAGFGSIDEGYWLALLAINALFIVVWSYAAFVLWSSPLFGRGVGLARSAASVLAVSAVMLLNGFVVLASSWGRASALEVLYILLSAFVVLGCVAAFQSSWQEQDAGSMTP